MLYLICSFINNLQIGGSISMVSIPWLHKIPAVRSATNLLKTKNRKSKYKQNTINFLLIQLTLFINDSISLQSNIFSQGFCLNYL